MGAGSIKTLRTAENTEVFNTVKPHIYRVSSFGTAPAITSTPKLKLGTYFVDLERMLRQSRPQQNLRSERKDKQNSVKHSVQHAHCLIRLHMYQKLIKAIKGPHTALGVLYCIKSDICDIGVLYKGFYMMLGFTVMIARVHVIYCISSYMVIEVSNDIRHQGLIEGLRAQIQCQGFI